MASELIVQTLKGPTSGANANKVIVPSGHTFDASGGTLVPSAGQVVQVKYVDNSTQVSVSAAGLVDIGLSLSITPSSINSKFLLLAKVSTNHITQNSGYGSGWIRNGTTILSELLEQYNSLSNGMRNSAFFQYYDSPSTTSAITYEFKPNSFSSQTIDFNETNRGRSSLTVWEIAQ